MADVVRFPKPFKARPEPRPKKPQKVKKAWRNPHRRDPWHVVLATFDVTGKDWDFYRREGLAADVLALLLKHGKVTVDRLPPARLYRHGRRQHLTDRLIYKLVGENFNFLKRGKECRPPTWLPSSMRFASYAYHDDVEETKGDD